MRLMYLIYLVLSVLVILMARRARRRFRPYLKGAVNLDLALGTLGAETLTSGTPAGVLVEKAWITSVKAVYSLADFTDKTDAGPIVVGLAHSDYTSAEIEEWIENATGSWNSGNLTQQEVSARKIRRIGSFKSIPGVNDGIDTLNEGRPIRTKCGWQLTTGDTVRFWAYNTGAAALTDGTIFHVDGFANLWPN